MKYRLAFSLVAVLFACSIAMAAEPPPQAPAAATGESVDLTFLHINDPHGHTAPYKSEAGKDVGGYARLATLV